MDTKYDGIVKDIKNQLANGDLLAGSKLPSVRQMSEIFPAVKTLLLKHTMN